MNLFWLMLIGIVLFVIAEYGQYIVILLGIGVLTGAVFFAIDCYMKKKQMQKEEEIELSFEDIDCMDGIEFEHFVADVLRKNDFNSVVVTKSSGDYGVDITAEKQKQKYAFQCKCYKRTLGLKPIQEVYAGAKKYGAGQMVVVTNSYFSKNAKILAQELGVDLWDRNVLGEMIWINKKKEEKEEHPVCVIQNEKVEHCILEQPVKFDKLEEMDMATQIGAGKYVFGEDIPIGKYNLKAISGEGRLKIQTGEDENGKTPYDWMDFGTKNYCAKTYNGLSLPEGWWFSIEDSCVVEITRSKMLQID